MEQSSTVVIYKEYLKLNHTLGLTLLTPGLVYISINHIPSDSRSFMVVISVVVDVVVVGRGFIFFTFSFVVPIAVTFLPPILYVKLHLRYICNNKCI